MKRITTTLLFLTALSTPAMAESPVERSYHSWDYVQQVANPPTQAEAPVTEQHHESRPMYHHEPSHHEGKHHHKHHAGKAHHGKHHHHHHKDKGDAGKDKPKDQPKQ